MTGLRARHKADRTRRMQEAAAGLFREAGYGAARMEDIAAAADVSVGTLYNYFETKGDLLLAIVSMEVEEVLSEGALVLANPPADPVEALDALIGRYFDHSLVYLSKATWRTAMALSIEAPDTPFSQRYTELDRMLTEQVCDMIRALQRRGKLRADVAAAVVGEVVFNTLNQMFIEFVKSDSMDLDTLRATVRRQTGLIIGAIAG
ncbi:MAG: TetR/AcrR family transcriptional regulator [Tabrizicola sp.]|uniref:TetR/AcrR family transcriptional regulator n=1 Tax=Tabrizicola sp. TaxID=2005166 RepID=UPI0027337069|nr:TetR/AcrR family transcriptional regulator [Tabrizicola sp.]MDP3261429.1 TetR/AcrR family transcriptional regulator [Tabrizicola sp.]MDP3649218.1 TetR/AcrR family transcriptional regulator [Paracoccaceae bacterium]MDZ4068361.1 TetR/AcrR family transcriptional regulator [Tabrizicola sp.]